MEIIKPYFNILNDKIKELLNKYIKINSKTALFENILSFDVKEYKIKGLSL